MKIAAGIVLFNPNLDRLKVTLDSVCQQYDEVVVFDNVGDQESFVSSYNNVLYLTEKQNKGIAYALNRIMEQSMNLGCDWVVTLDQDTLLPDNLLNEFKKNLNYPNIAIFAPQVIDKRRPYIKVEEKKDTLVDIDMCITSASCTNVAIWEKLGKFDEWLFIDFVDNDYCKRAKLAGFRILQLTDVVIDQEFGQIKLKSPKKVAFFMWLSKVLHNKNIAKLTYSKVVSPLRVYFVHRNLLYLNKKFKSYGGIGYENFYCNSFLGFLFYFSLPSVVRAQDKIKVLKAVIKGLWDGCKSISTPIS